jgi:tyrosine-protein kinase Etk/Wzc
MEENSTNVNSVINGTELQNEEESSINFQTILANIIIYWKWFVLSIVVCLLIAFIYLRYTQPTYEITAKILVKEEENRRSRGSDILSNMQDLGFISNSVGIDNEVEILQAHVLSKDVIKDLKLYVEYRTEGHVTDQLCYKTNPINVDIDQAHLEKLKFPITLEINKSEQTYEVQGETYTEDGESVPFETSFTSLPVSINTKYGTLTLTRNTGNSFDKDRALLVKIMPLDNITDYYVRNMTVEPTSKTTSIALITLHDINSERATDFLRQMAICYNRQANIDKNEVAVKTEEFINSRLEKINSELGSTEGALESYKKRNKLTELKLDATSTLEGSSSYEQKLADATTQIQLLGYLSEYIADPNNKNQVIPSNVGLTDLSSTELIKKYNESVLERNRLLRSASENSPTVQTVTNTMNELSGSISKALSQARRGMEIQRQGIEKQYNLYSGKVQSTPEQERILTQIGRQQEVKSGLYLMLLQKREENSISLAATADKGKLIDDPQYMGKVSPKSAMIWLIALILGAALPLGILYLLQLLRYKIEGHDDVEKLTKVPIIADIPTANISAMGKGDIVVHENRNGQMEEVFRSMRTNMQFMMKENAKVILFTSSTSGEGKTFTASNLAISFALLGKKVIIVGCDIRKPRLAQLFQIKDQGYGLTNLLREDNVTKQSVMKQVSHSGVNDNLDIMFSGPIPPNPAELLARTNVEKTVEYLKEEYDYVILDTAPVGLVSDTLLLGRVTDATIFVCRADYTPKASFGLINGINEEQKLPNMSLAINGVDMSKRKYGYYYGYGHYGRYKSYKGYGYGYGYGHYGKVYGKDEKDESIKQ